MYDLLKICTKCKIEKNISSFYSKGYERYKGGLDTFCKICRNLHRKRMQQKKKPKRSKEHHRKVNLKYNYGLSIEEFNSLLESQQYSCKICKTTSPIGKHNQWCVDHCHKSGKLRGILCPKCNMALGLFNDSIESLEQAIAYLKET